MKNHTWNLASFFTLISTLLFFPVTVTLVEASSAHRDPTIKESGIDLFSFRCAQIWGEGNIWSPTPTVWVQYESDLGERSAVDFENGTVKVQLLVSIDEEATSGQVIAHLRQGVRNLILGDADDPIEIVILNEQKKSPLPKSDSFRSHDLTLGYDRPSTSKNPLLLDQIRKKDGNLVKYEDVDSFTEQVVTLRSVKKKIITGRDGIKRQAVGVEFSLAPNHLEIRAKRFYPSVRSYSTKYGLEPSLIMGIIHTESMFNPRARSHAPAFGLMQLVPKTGAREAYRRLHGKDITPSPQYLYTPNNNIMLGVVYFDLLLNRYLHKIDDETSRTYCAIAAYNAGASNVGQAFIPKKSINKASPIINKLAPQEVYTVLSSNLPALESRVYLKKVLTRSVIYSGWQ